MNAHCEQLIDGRVAVKWVPGVSGEFTTSISINGMPIGGSPFTSNTLNGKIDSSRSEVIGFPKRVVAGNWMRCQVVIRDQFGNLATYQPLAGNGFKFFAEATGPIAISGDVLDTGEGTRDIAFPFTTLGTYKVTIEGEDGIQVRCSTRPICPCSS